MLIDLIPKMANIFNDFMMEYSKRIKGFENDTNQLFKFHTELTNVYAIKAIKLAMQYLNDEKIEAGFSDWLKERGMK